MFRLFPNGERAEWTKLSKAQFLNVKISTAVNFLDGKFSQIEISSIPTFVDARFSVSKISSAQI